MDVKCVSLLLMILMSRDWTYPGVQAATLSKISGLSDSEMEEVVLDLLESELAAILQETVDKDEYRARKWLELANQQLQFWQNKIALAQWNFETNITDANKNILSQTDTNYSTWHTHVKHQAEYLRENSALLDQDLLRQLNLMMKFANPSRPQDVRELKNLESEMGEIYSIARVCTSREKCLSLEPDLIVSMATSHDPEQLKWTWDSWRNAVGPQLKPLYVNYTRLLNKGARENGYKDYSDYWKDAQFDASPELQAICERLVLEVMPLYLDLHAYVRQRLTKFYGAEVVGENGAIPAHLLGDMWSQSWEMISEIVIPSPSRAVNDAVAAAKKNLKKTYNVEKMFKLAEEFYTSIGLFSMTDTFWEKSMLVKPDGREASCHGSASDLYSKDDFRIKMCTEVTMSDLHTIHHEMGHIEYFMAHEDQPTVYRSGANSAFHEAVGDTIALSVMNRKHLHRLGLIDKPSADRNETIADLLHMALRKVAFLPYSYLLDKWRWALFRGDITEENMNREYWKLRLEYQGIVAPVPRSESDFDPGAKYHVPFNSPYICYFIGVIIQFQFYESLCSESGHRGPLHTCDFYGSEAAGAKLKSMLELGASKPWPEALEQVTGSRVISVDALLEYFKPLVEWLKEENKGNKPGWENANINWA